MSQLLARPHVVHGAGSGEVSGPLPDGVAGSALLAGAPRWAGIATILVLGFLAHFRAVGSLFLLDDFLHESMLDGHYPGARSPLDLYAFIDDSNRSLLLERGLLPWWTHPDLTVRFFRPLSSALIWLDRALFGDAPLPMHLHSLAWWACAVIGAHALYRRALGARVAWIAALIFAVAPCHAMPLAWIANRDALLSLGLGAWGLAWYVQWREDGGFRAAAFAFGLFSLALLAGEYAISFLGYVIAIELVRRGDTLARRVSGVLPYVVPAVTYVVTRAALGYGTRHSGFYTDPLDDTELFLWFAPERLAQNVLQVWLALGRDTTPGDTPIWVIAGSVVLLAALVGLALRESFASLDAPARHATSWFLVGSVLALAPVLAALPSPRLVGAATLGVAPVAAIILDGAWFRAGPAPRRGMRELAYSVAIVIAFCQLIRGPGEAWLLGGHHAETSHSFMRAVSTVAEATPNRVDADLLVIRARGAGWPIPFALGEGGPPRRYRVLSQTGHVLVQRVDERTLDLFGPLDTGIYPWGGGNLFLDARSIPSVDDVLEVSGMRVTILRVDEGRVLAARFELDDDVEAFTVMNETHDGYVLAELPPIGFGAPFNSEPPPTE